jgi:phage gp36-like protein
MDHINATELGQLSALPAAILAELNSGDVAVAITAGTATVNSFLASRGLLPFTVVPSDVKQATADIVGYRLASKHGYANEGDNSDLRDRYDDAMKWLERVARGLATPDVTASNPRPTSFARVLSRAPRGW